MRRIVLLAPLLALVPGATGAGSTTSSVPTVIRFGLLWDGTRTIRNAVVVVADGRIASVGTEAVSVPLGAEAIDLSRFTGLPGLIDSHTHITYVWDRAPDTTPLKQPPRSVDERIRASAMNALRALEAGVTTARDLGASGGADIQMRDLIKEEKMLGPRLFVAGQGISAGRGGALDAAAARAAAEARLATSADWIKVYASRGSYSSVDTTQTIGFEALQAIVEAGHAKGRKVAIHSYGASGVRDAVRAGADSVEHGIELDAETIALMVKQGTVWVPTIDHNRYYVEAKDEFQFAPETIPPLKAYIEKNLESTRAAVKAGVKLAAGSDAVFSMFGQNMRELGWFVKAGMTPEQALRTATIIPAEMLGQQNRLGRVAAGFTADLVAVEGNPLQSIDALFTGVRWVMKDGAVVVDKRK